jgi:hypothetical protein
LVNLHSGFRFPLICLHCDPVRFFTRSN